MTISRHHHTKKSEDELDGHHFNKDDVTDRPKTATKTVNTAVVFQPKEFHFHVYFDEDDEQSKHEAMLIRSEIVSKSLQVQQFSPSAFPPSDTTNAVSVVTATPVGKCVGVPLHSIEELKSLYPSGGPTTAALVKGDANEGSSIAASGEMDEVVVDERRSSGDPGPVPHGVNLRPVGPHPTGSFEVWVPIEHFSTAYLWFLQHRRGHPILIHPLTINQLEDHTTSAAWMIGGPNSADESYKQIPSLNLAALSPPRLESLSSQYPELGLGYKDEIYYN